MNTQEQVSMINTILSLLQQLNLNWVIRHVGISVMGTEAEYSNEDEIVTLLRNTDRPREVLIYLLDAVQHGIIDRIAISQWLSVFFRDGTYLRIDSNSDSQFNIQYAFELQQTINEIREAVENG